MHDNIIYLKIRPAVFYDFAYIADIYDEYVKNTIVTFEILPPTAAEMLLRWKKTQQLDAPFLVAVVAGKVVGYAYAGADNPTSVKLHQSCGFVTVGCLKGVGDKFGQWLDTTLMQRAL